MKEIQHQQTWFTRKILTKRRDEVEELVVLAFLLISAIAIRIRNLNLPLVGSDDFRKTQTAWGIRSVAEGVLSPFSVETPVLGPPWKVPFEFPLYQLIAGFFSRLTGFSVEASGRLTSIAFFISSALFIYIILKKFFDKKVCVATLFVYLFCSYNLEYGSVVLIEYCAVFFSLAAFWFAIKYFESSKNQFLILFISAASVAGLVKITTSIVWVMFGALALAFIVKPRIRCASLVLISGLIAHVPAILWTYWADEQKSKSPMTLWLTTSNLRRHNFGTLRQRTVPVDWHRAISHFLTSVVGMMVIAVGLVFIAISFNSKRRIPVAFFLLFLSGPLIFVNLYFFHDYYWIAVLPAFLIVLAAGLDTLQKLIQNPFDKKQVPIFQFSLVVGLVMASWVSPYGTNHFEAFRKSEYADTWFAAEKIKKFTNADDKIIVIGADWGPQILFYANRKGLMIPHGWDPVSTIDETQLGTFYSYIYWYSGDNMEDTVQSIAGDAELELIDGNLYKIVTG